MHATHVGVTQGTVPLELELQAAHTGAGDRSGPLEELCELLTAQRSSQPRC